MADAKNDGGSAFPMHPEGVDFGGRPYEHTRGMSLRDWFAGQALAGLLQNEDAVSEIQQAARAEGETYPAYASGIAYAIADAMLAERAKEGGGE